MRAPIGDFEHAEPAAEAAEFTGPAADAVRAGHTGVPPEQLIYVSTEPEWADTEVFVEHYGAELMQQSANCVVVAAKRGGERSLAACLVPSAAQLDVNGAARRQLGARKLSFAPVETAVEATGMEYGGITPVGLPEGWPLLIDPEVAELPWVLIGSGRRTGKLLAPGKVLAALPGVALVDGLGQRGGE